MLDFARKLSLPSSIKYVFWRLLRRPAVTVRMRSGPRFEIRRKDICANNDYGVAYEVFVEDCYGADTRPDASEVRFIVDMGTNVGLSSLKFLSQYPGARVLAFEPHPEHAAQARRNFMLSGVADRVTLIEAGAAAKARPMSFLSNMSGSRVLAEGETGTMTVQLVDALAMLEGKRIDLFKMDIEGGEYEVMGDPRFASLDIGRFVMEWHRRGDAAEDKKWCQEKLALLGFNTKDIFSRDWGGMMWARRP